MKLYSLFAIPLIFAGLVRADNNTGTSQPTSSAGVQDVQELELLDAIRAIIYTTDGVDVITLSIIERPSLDGSKKTLEDLIDDYLIYRDGSAKATISEAALDSTIAQFKKQNNLTDEQLLHLFENAGYTLTEGRQEFRRMQMIAQMIDHNVLSKIRVISESDIQRYYQEHPVYDQTTYTIEYARIPATHVENGKVGSYENIEWMELPIVKENELAQHTRFITSLRVGEISKPRAVDGEYELFRLKHKKKSAPIPLEIRRQEIVDSLRKPLYEKALSDYKQRLRKAAYIVYFDETNDQQLADLIE